MTERRITDSDIVDVLLGQAPSQVEGAVQKAARMDADIAATYDEWTRILAAAKLEGQQAEAVTQRVCETVMKLVEQEKRHRPAQPPTRKGLREEWSARLGRKRVLAPLAAAIAVCLIGAMVVPMMMYRDGDVFQLEGRVTYVDFAARTVEEGGSEDLPYSTLGRAVQAAPEGGIIVIRPSITGVKLSETIRIAKPLRLEVQSGRVRAGRE